VRGVHGLVHGDEHDDQHGHDVNAQRPKQGLGSERKISPAKMGAALGGDDLIRFEQRENGARIAQAELLRFDVNRDERALIFRNIGVM